MKKILIIFLLFIPTAKAATYDLEFRPIEELNLKTEETKKYKWYKNETIGAYFIEGENPKIFSIKTNDYYFSPYTEWSKEKPSSVIGREIREREKYIYSDINQVRHLSIEVDSKEKVISEFATLVNGGVVNASSYCTGCSESYYMYINNSKYDQTFSIGKIFSTLEEYYNPNELSFRVKFDQPNIKYKITIYGDKEFKTIYYEKEFISDTSLHIYNLADFSNMIGEENEIIKYSESSKYQLKEKYKEYSYRDKLYKYEATIRNYYPTYEEKLDGYIKDENDYITLNKYYYMDQVKIKDNIEITSTQYDLLDYVSSNIEPLITSNIDLSKNGTYQVKYIFPTKTIETKVKVNTNKEYVEDLERKIENKNKEILDVTNLKNEIIERLESSLKSKDEIISKKNIQTVVKKSSPIPVILITLGITTIIFCIYKSFSKKIKV